MRRPSPHWPSSSNCLRWLTGYTSHRCALSLGGLDSTSAVLAKTSFSARHEGRVYSLLLFAVQRLVRTLAFSSCLRPSADLVSTGLALRAYAPSSSTVRDICQPERTFRYVFFPLRTLSRNSRGSLDPSRLPCYIGPRELNSLDFSF